LFIPDLGRYLNRRPTYTLTRPATAGTVPGTIQEEPIIEEAAEDFVEREERPQAARTYTLTSMTSRLDDTHFAVLPHGERLEGWSAAAFEKRKIQEKYEGLWAVCQKA
jgi:hypothetical protein